MHMCGRIRVKMGPQISNIRIIPARNQVHDFEKIFKKLRIFNLYGIFSM